MKSHRYARPSLSANALFSALAILLLPGWLDAADDSPRVKLSTGLGVEAEVSVRSTRLDNDVLNHALRTPYGEWSLPLKVADGVYLSLPLDAVRSVSTREGKHLVQMTNGQELKGKLSGKIHTIDQKSYELADTQSLDVLSVPKPRLPTEAKTYNETWELTISNADGLSYNVVTPVFAFQYWSGSGYVIGGRDRETSTKSFYLKVGEQEHLAHIEDFTRLTVAMLAKTKGVQLTVESKTGVKTSGSLVLKGSDSRGYHPGHSDWVLAARMASNYRIRVIVSKKQWTLIQKSQ